MTIDVPPSLLHDAERHPSFRVPEDPATQIWRYTDFTKFVDLLERRALFFGRADAMDDPFEGTYTRPNMDERKLRMLEALPKMTVP